ncbi:MAG TPA: 3-methyl-2-oxobutanoate hydroxymethyltransferase [Nevskiaceae bacterium]
MSQDSSQPEHPRPSAAAATIQVQELRRMRAVGERIAALTCYDASFAILEERAGVDVVLVGDSLGMVMQGRPTTTAVSVDDIVYHCRCVAPHLRRAFLVADLPFLSYATKERALASSQRLMQQGGAQMVKLEGSRDQADIVEYLSTRGIPVCAHLGLRPQLIHKMGRFRVQGREPDAAEAMRRDARVLQDAGADLMVLECVPATLGRETTDEVEIPVIGIGAGPDTSGQILVLQDILNISPQASAGHVARFVQDFMDGAADILGALSAYVAAVRSGTYPAPQHCFGSSH